MEKEFCLEEITGIIPNEKIIVSSFYSLLYISFTLKF